MTKAYDSAIRLLARREHGANELCLKLEQKGFSRIDSQEALAQCQRLNLQSDQRFVESFIRSRIRQGYGPMKIMQELKTKGVASDLIHQELKLEEDNWWTYALEVWQKKCRGAQDLSFSELQKQQRFLLYRGFSSDIIARVVKELA